MTKEPDSQLVATDLLPLTLDVWRLSRMTEGDERLHTLASRALDRLRALGLRLETLEGNPFDENAKVRVVEHRPGPEPRTVVECVTPAIYWNDQLLKEANVITKGQA